MGIDFPKHLRRVFRAGSDVRVREVIQSIESIARNAIPSGSSPGTIPPIPAANKSGFEAAIAENSTRVVTFNTEFAAIPAVVVSFADSSSEISVIAVHTVSVGGFTIAVTKSGGGGSASRDVSWIAIVAGNP